MLNCKTFSLNSCKTTAVGMATEPQGNKEGMPTEGMIMTTTCVTSRPSGCSVALTSTWRVLLDTVPATQCHTTGVACCCLIQTEHIVHLFALYNYNLNVMRSSCGANIISISPCPLAEPSPLDGIIIDLPCCLIPST